MVRFLTLGFHQVYFMHARQWGKDTHSLKSLSPTERDFGCLVDWL